MSTTDKETNYYTVTLVGDYFTMTVCVTVASVESDAEEIEEEMLTAAAIEIVEEYYGWDVGSHVTDSTVERLEN